MVKSRLILQWHVVAGILLNAAAGLFACTAGASQSPVNQGTIQQTADGKITVHLTNLGLSEDPRITETSVVVFYLYKKSDYTTQCKSARERQKCEDAMVFKNAAPDGLAYTNEPGFYGFDPDRGSYFPVLNAPAGQSYPDVKPADPQGFSDADIWQCIRNPFSHSPNHGKFECGINAHPIRYFNRDFTSYSMGVHGTTPRGIPASYGGEYAQFMNSEHPVKDGDKYFGYFAVYYSAMLPAGDAEDRFDPASAVFKRSIEPDRVSPRIEMTISLEPAGKKPAGSTYEIPDYNSWYDPFTSCRATQNVPANSLYFSEVLWMGSKNISGAGSSEDEFIEIYNSNSYDVVLSGWRITGAGSGSASISLPQCAVIKSQGIFTIGKQTTRAFVKLDYVDPGLSLSNSGEAQLGIQDAAGNTVSSLSGCTSPAWGGQGILGTAGNANRSMRLASVAVPSPSCTYGWVSSSVSDAAYSAASQNLSAAYKAESDSGVDGTIATPGFKGP